MRVLGIDEAGRGCVLGPLFVAGYVADGVSEQVLRDAGAADSKTLTAERRSLARARLEPIGRPDVRSVAATTIDDGNLNALEEAIIVELVALHRPDVVIVDALGHPRTLPRILERLQSRVPASCADCRWIMEPGADDTHAIVGAASIFAKTTRDAALDELKAEFGDLGSGYPHDPATKTWLRGWAATGRPWPPFVRTRWETIRVLAQEALFAPPPAPAAPAKGAKKPRIRRQP